MKTTTRKMTAMLRQLGLGAGLTVFTASAALAIPAPIGSFDVSQEFEFISANPAGVDKTGGSPGVIDGFTKLEWGVPWFDVDGPRSSLVINPEATDSTEPTNDLIEGPAIVTANNGADGVTTFLDIDFAIGPELVHNNFIISGTSLNSAVARDNVILSVAGDTKETSSLQFDINFEETDNNQTEADCEASYADPTLPKAWSPYNNAQGGCGDIFVLDLTQLVPTLVNDIGSLGGVNPVPAFLIDVFNVGAYQYDVYLREVSDSIQALSTDACVAATGSSDACIGFVTNENESNFFQLAFGIVSTPRDVPVPATLFLMGGSLLSMAWFRRRKSAKSA